MNKSLEHYKPLIKLLSFVLLYINSSFSQIPPNFIQYIQSEIPFFIVPDSNWFNKPDQEILFSCNLNDNKMQDYVVILIIPENNKLNAEIIALFDFYSSNKSIHRVAKIDTEIKEISTGMKIIINGDIKIYNSGYYTKNNGGSELTHEPLELKNDAIGYSPHSQYLYIWNSDSSKFIRDYLYLD